MVTGSADSRRKETDGHGSVSVFQGVYGRRMSPVLRLCVTAMLCALGVVGRIALWSVPNVQPVTVLIILITIYISLPYGLVSALVMACVTNMFMGSLGIWTLYQSFAWICAALIAWLLFRKKQNYILMVAYAFLAGFIYGFIVDAISWRIFVQYNSAATFWAYKVTSLPYDLYHSLGNAVFMYFLDPLFGKAFEAVILRRR